MFNEYKQFDLAQLDHAMLEQWLGEKLFERSTDLQKGRPRFVFFDGPPSANGMPGIHHVMARTIKDTFCRYKTMCGYRVDRKAGWDTHGLPVELGVEKKLGITKEDIGSKISVDDYNRACREEVMKYTREWEKLTLDMGYWVDLEHPYITYDNKYIETLWYLLSELYKKGLLYKGYTIQPYSPAAGTGLSSHELNQPGCYRDVKDTTCTAQFSLDIATIADAELRHAVEEQQLPFYALAWTTTPWTLPSNTALCVGEKIEYVVVRAANPYSKAEGLFLMARARLSHYFKDATEYTEIAALKGNALLGIRYRQLFDWVRPDGDAFRIISGDYVTTDDGTGIVHIAPTFGADDAFVARKAGIAALTMLTAKGETRPMVDMTGKFFLISDLDADYVSRHVNIDNYSAWQGRYVKNAYDDTLSADDTTLDIDLCVVLKAEGKVFKIEKHEHSYPHCWRTDKPVIYYPLDSWFIRASSVKEEMSELNTTITWQPPSTGSGRFGKWLENLNDWNLSRSRYWGTPLPIWRTEDGSEEICVGSVAELYDRIEDAVRAGVMKANPWHKFRKGDFSDDNYSTAVLDLHRPYVDAIVLVSPTGKPMYRETDLIDVWFDSGAMPYAQLHYPFENADEPTTADFISEGVDQTRGWFYTLHAIHTMVDHTVAFRNVISNGLVLDKYGNKMSKRLGNAVDPFETMNEYGADAVRWYMMTNSSPWDNLRFDEEGIKEIRRKFFMTLQSCYSFFALYANVDHYQPDDLSAGRRSTNILDRWLHSRLQSLIRSVTDSYEGYDPTKAGRAVSDFVQDELSNWYVRLCRKRFWQSGDNADKRAAYDTLYSALRTVALLMAPLAPFYADRLYRDLTDGQSVHLAQWPKPDDTLVDADLEKAMTRAGQVTSTILALRKKANIRVRQPLPLAVVPAPDADTHRQLDMLRDIVENETNIRELRLITSDDGQFRLVKKIRPQFRVLGKKLGGQMKTAAAEIAAMTQEQIRTLQDTGEWKLSTVDYTLQSEDVEITTEDMPGWMIETIADLTVALDIELDDELIAEGTAREVVNRLQNMRKAADLNITDRIRVQLWCDDTAQQQLDSKRDYVMQQTLCVELTLLPLAQHPSEDAATALDIEGATMYATIQKI